MWVHINFIFIKPHLTQKQYKKFTKYLGYQIQPYLNIIRRKYFLFEPYPHCFLALQIPPYAKEMLIELFYYYMPDFVKRVYFTEHTDDEANGKYFLDIMNSLTNFNLFSDKKIYHPNIKFSKQYRALIHLFHCMLNQFLYKKETRLYKYMLEHYEKNTRNRSGRTRSQ